MITLTATSGGSDPDADLILSISVALAGSSSDPPILRCPATDRDFHQLGDVRQRRTYAMNYAGPSS